MGCRHLANRALCMGSSTPSNGQSELLNSSSSGNLSVPVEGISKASFGRLSISQNSDPVKETKSSGRLSTSQNSDLNKEPKSFPSTGSVPGTPQRVNLSPGPKVAPISSTVVLNAAAPKRNTVKVQSVSNASVTNRSDVIPVVVPRNNLRFEQAAESRKEGIIGRTMPLSLQSRGSDVRSSSNIRDDLDRPIASSQPEIQIAKGAELSGVTDKKNVPMADETRVPHVNRESNMTDGRKAGRTRSLVANWERRERVPYSEGLASNNIPVTVHAVKTPPINMGGHSLSPENEIVSTSEEDVIADLMKHHDQFVGSMQSRLVKLQMIQNYWQRFDVKGALSAMQKMGDHGVIADVMSLLTEKADIVTLDICTSLLPLLNGLLESDMDRHQNVSLDMLLKLVRVFGSVIYSSISAPSSVGVDIEAEQRLERCNMCFIELEKVKHCLPVLCRRGGSIAKSAHELNLALQEIS